VKVKELIQALLERLLREAAAEATKQGFCDKELGVARQTRDNRLAETKTLNADLALLEAKKDSLELEIERLNASAADLRISLANATSARADERAGNLDAIEKAKEGRKAVSGAIAVLRSFYRQAKKTVTALTQASPIEEDDPGAGFSDTYHANQDASKGIFGLLEVIKSDFDRTVRMTEAQEKQATADFVELDRSARADITGMVTKAELDTQELAAVNSGLDRKMDDLRTAQGLLDDALRAIMNLKPMCIDTGMSFADREKAREDEITALKQALTILAPEPDHASP